MNFRYIYAFVVSVSLSLPISGQVGISTKQVDSNKILYIDSNGNNSQPATASEMVDDIVISTDGSVGINVVFPLQKISVNSGGTWIDQKPAIRIKDGNEQKGYIFQYKGGIATWRPSNFNASKAAVFPYRVGMAHSNFLSLPVTQTGFYSTGTTLTLAPGTWLVYVAFLPRCDSDGSISGAKCYTGNSDLEQVWVSASFADGNVPIKSIASISSDFIGNNKQISGTYYKAKTFNTINGQIVIHNSTNADKVYTFVIGNFVNMGTNTDILLNGLGAGYSLEDSIVAFRFK